MAVTVKRAFIDGARTSIRPTLETSSAVENLRLRFAPPEWAVIVGVKFSGRHFGSKGWLA